MTSSRTHRTVLHLVYGLISLVALSSAVVLALVYQQSKHREELLAVNSSLHLQVLKDVTALREVVAPLAEFAPNRGPADRFLQDLDRARSTITRQIGDITSLHQRFGFPEANPALLRLQQEAEALDGMAWQMSGGRLNDVEQFRARLDGFNARLTQLGRLHEVAREDLQGELLSAQRTGVRILTALVMLSLATCGLLVIAIIRGIRLLLTRLGQIDRSLRETEQRQRQILDSMFAVVCLFSSDGVLLEVNRAPLAVAGIKRKDVIGKPFWDTYWVSYAPAVQGQVREALARAAAGETIRKEIVVRAADDRFLTIDATCAPLYNASGAIDKLIVSGVDVSARKAAETNAHTLSSAVEHASDSVMVTDRHGVITYVNPAFERITGYTATEVVGRKPNLLKSGQHGDDFYRLLWETILGGNTFSEVFTNRHKNGEFYSEEKTITPIKNQDGDMAHFVAIGRDVTKRIQSQERLQFLASHDSLTSLPNRTLFLDRLDRAIIRARWSKRLVAILFVDLDHFKHINDTLGHNVGDELLRVLATRLTATLRDGDSVARFGGDEFVILLDDVANPGDIRNVSQKILDAMKPPVQLGGTTLHVSASIGVSTFPSDGQEPGTLLKHADIAMYRAKDAGRNACQFYSREMSSHALERLSIETSLHQAVQRREFALHYQPLVCVPARQLVGVEALLRWRHPDMGLVAPNDFVPVLEETGMIVSVSEWALNEAFTQAARWRATGSPKLRLYVNISSRHFVEPNLSAFIAESMARVGLPPDAVEIEITESLLLRPTDVTQRTIKALDELGVRFGLDDFGTGYSSLSYLQRFPCHTLKIDRSFIRDLPDDEHAAALTRAIVAMGRSLKLDLVAEGVENDAQRDFLVAHQCETMQGFLFSRPLPVDEMTALLRDPLRLFPPDKLAANF